MLDPFALLVDPACAFLTAAPSPTVKNLVAQFLQFLYCLLLCFIGCTVTLVFILGYRKDHFDSLSELRLRFQTFHEPLRSVKHGASF